MNVKEVEERGRRGGGRGVPFPASSVIFSAGGGETSNQTFLQGRLLLGEQRKKKEMEEEGRMRRRYHRNRVPLPWELLAVM